MRTSPQSSAILKCRIAGYSIAITIFLECFDQSRGQVTKKVRKKRK